MGFEVFGTVDVELFFYYHIIQIIFLVTDIACEISGHTL